MSNNSQINVTDEVEKRRFEVCKSCSSYDATAENCNENNISVTVLILLPDNKCPINKW